MNLDQLKYIAYLQQAGSLSKVADHFFTSHQVIRHAMLSLENELDIKLIQSSNQGSLLTKAGIYVAQYAQKTCEDFQKLEQQLRPLKASSSATAAIIHVNIAPSMATDYYLDLFDRYADSNSAIKLDIRISSFSQILDILHSFEDTIYILPIMANSAIMNKLKNDVADYNLTVIFLSRQTNFLCVHKKSKYAKLRSCSFSDLENALLYVFFNSNPYCLSDSDDQLENIHYFGDFNALKRMLKENYSAAIIKQSDFDYYFGKNKSEYVLIPLSDDNMIDYVAIVPNGPSLTSPIRDVLNFLRNSI